MPFSRFVARYQFSIYLASLLQQRHGFAPILLGGHFLLLNPPLQVAELLEKAARTFSSLRRMARHIQIRWIAIFTLT
jgi:hypothetical protein